MNIDEIKRLVQLMIENDLSEIDISDGESKVLLKRGAGAAPAITTMPVAPAAAPGAAAPAGNLVEIRSPMVGTFYGAPSPDSEPYVKVGVAVDADAVVCVVEAMKVMNEIKAECSGTIAEICVRNEQPVEFGQVLFRVRPA